MSYETALYIRVAGEQAEDSGDGLTFNLHGRAVQESPLPVVLSNGEIVDPDDYTIDYGDADTNGAITFDTDRTSETITCDYRWKYECGPGEDPMVLELEKDLNIRALKDVNGRTMVVENLVKTCGWSGVITWKYMSRDFWNEIRILVEAPGYLFDIERTSADAPLDLIGNLYPMKYPAFKEEPGVPGMTQVTIEAVQLQSA